MTPCVSCAVKDARRAGPFRVAVLVSGGGTNLQSLIDSVHRPGGGIEIVLVVGSRPDAFGLERGLMTTVHATTATQKASRP